MTQKLSIDANFTVLINCAKRYLAARKPHWPIDQISGEELVKIGYRLAQQKAKGDFAEIMRTRTQARKPLAICRPTIGRLAFKRFDPQNPPKNLMKRCNLRRICKRLG